MEGSLPQGDPNQRQAVQDLAAFYHQTGILLERGRMDRDFTLLLVGRGLAERWAVFAQLPTFYREAKPGEEFAYGGLYLLFDAYQRWQGKRLGAVQGQFERAAQRIARRQHAAKRP